MGNTNRFKGKGDTAYSKPENIIEKTKAGKVHKCLVIPRALHEVVSEVSFLEKISVKDLITPAIEDELYRLSRPSRQSSPGDETMSSSFFFKSSDGLVHTSIYIAEELIARMRETAHYSKTSERKIVTNGLARLLLQEYTEKYRDLVAPIEKHRCINEA